MLRPHVSHGVRSMRRFWSVAVVLGLSLCALAVAASGCHERERRVEVIRERPAREVRVVHERDVRVEHERRGHERDRDGERDRGHD